MANAITAPPHLEMRPERAAKFSSHGANHGAAHYIQLPGTSNGGAEFTVPPFTVQVYGNGHCSRRSTAGGYPAFRPMATPQQLTLEVLTTNLFVGRPANVRILLPASAAGMPQGLTQVQLIGQGFIMDQGARDRKSKRQRGAPAM